MGIMGPFNEFPYYEIYEEGEKKANQHEEEMRKEQEHAFEKENDKPGDHTKNEGLKERKEKEIEPSSKEPEALRDRPEDLSSFEESQYISKKNEVMREAGEVIERENDLHERIKLKAIREQELKGETFRG